jgi:hypothetical protein
MFHVTSFCVIVLFVFQGEAGSGSRPHEPPPEHTAHAGGKP